MDIEQRKKIACQLLQILKQQQATIEDTEMIINIMQRTLEIIRNRKIDAIGNEQLQE